MRQPSSGLAPRSPHVPAHHSAGELLAQFPAPASTQPSGGTSPATNDAEVIAAHDPRPGPGEAGAPEKPFASAASRRRIVPPDALLIPVHEAARRLCRCRQHVSRMVDRGLLRAKGPRGNRQIVAASIQEYLDAPDPDINRPGRSRPKRERPGLQSGPQRRRRP